MVDDDLVLRSDWMIHFEFNSGPPFADCGGPYFAEENTSVNLDASKSYDEDGITLFEWDLDGDGIFDRNRLTAIMTYKWNDDYKGLIFLRVTDGHGVNSLSSTYIIINNVPPVVNATMPETVFEGESRRYIAEVWDQSENDTITIIWDFGDGVGSIGKEVQHAFVDDGEYPCSLMVIDDDGGRTEVQFIVQVINLPPVLEPLPGFLEISEGERVFLQCSVADPGIMDTIDIKWRLDDILHSENGTFSWLPLSPGIFRLNLSATDDDGGIASTESEIRVNNVVQAVSIISVEDVSDHSVRVQWTMTKELGFQYYEILYDTRPGLTDPKAAQVSDRTTMDFLLDDLIPGRVYYIAVRLVVEDGDALSDIASVTLEKPTNEPQTSKVSWAIIVICCAIIIIILLYIRSQKWKGPISSK